MGQSDPSAFLGITVQDIQSKKVFGSQILYAVNMRVISRSQKMLGPHRNIEVEKI